MKVVLDFDGTLCNSMPLLQETAVELICETYGVPEKVALSDYRDTVGLSFSEQLAEIFPGDTRNDAVARRYEELHEVIYTKVTVFDDVYEALELLVDAGVSYAICSSSPSKLTWTVVSEKLAGYNFLITGREYGTKWEQLQRHFGRDGGYFIGDAIRDGQMAELLGIEFIGVTHTFTPDEFERENFTHASDVLAAVRTLLNQA